MAHAHGSGCVVQAGGCVCGARALLEKSVCPWPHRVAPARRCHRYKDKGYKSCIAAQVASRESPHSS
eukprot:scaffold32581_cov124-Isochrysis_galbana.AAC.8